MILAGCGGASHARDTSRVAGTDAPPAVRVTRKPAPVPPPLARLRASVRRARARAGGAGGAEVYDLTAGRELIGLRAGISRPPASLEKLYTTVALLKMLGAQSTLRTEVLGTGHLGPRGIWHGNLYLRGGGDPTFGDDTFNRAWEQGYGPTAGQLVQQLTAAGIRRVSGAVIADASLFDERRGVPSSGFAPDISDLGGQLSALTYDHGSTTDRLTPGAFAARELVLTMRQSRLQARAARSTAVTPDDARVLASVESPSMSILVKLMDLPSDDFFAEMLTKELGARFAGAGSTDAGTGVIARALATYGIHPKIVDGSGLSRADRSSPLEVVLLLRALWRTSIGRAVIAALPVVGVSGTASMIASGTPAQGRCVAKTGTLDNVTNLAGYCNSRGGQVLAFALFLDGPDNVRGRMLLGKMVAAIARY